MAARHARKSVHPRRRKAAIGLLGVAVVAIVVAAVAILVPTATQTPTASAATHPALGVEGIVPDGQWVSPDAQLRVMFNEPLSPTSALPQISPAVPGRWVLLSAGVLAFEPATAYATNVTYKVTVPATALSSYGTRLGHAVQNWFAVGGGSVLRLQQLLAQLGYLPLKFVPLGTFVPTSASVQRGTFVWRWANMPPGLTSLWQPGVMNTITEGALMRFEDVNNLGEARVPTPQTFNALIAAVAAHKSNPATYNYVDVNTALPETVTLYQDNRVIYTTLANSGIASRPTALGTFPVYLRFTSTTMSGTNPDGTTYHDPGIPWVSYFNGGDALHGFIRYSYGWPQSLGCIEMPFAHAAVVYPYTPIGTLVTVR